MARCVFCDIDNTTIDDALHRIKEADLPWPTVIVNSGHGVHLYWRLDEPTTDLQQWSMIQKQLAKLLDADPKVCDAPRIMRLPGSVNHKSEPVPCALIECVPERSYPLDDITGALPEESPVQGNLSDPTGIPADAVDTTIPAGRRNGTLTRYAGYLRRGGFSEGAILAALQAMNADQCRPPLDDAEVQRIAASVARYDPDANTVDQLTGEQIHRRKITRIDALDIQPPRWLIPGLIETHTLAQIYGASGAGKTFIALDLACRVATGGTWQDKRIECRPVVFVVGEGSAGIVRRARAWSIQNNTSLGGVPLYVTYAVAMTDAAGVATLTQAIDDAGERPGLVILDTLARNFGPGDENSTQDMSAYIASCDLIRRQYGCTVLNIHHTGLSATDRSRGNSALRAALDAEYRVELTDRARRLVATKAKESELPAPVDFDIVQRTLPGVMGDDGEPVTSAAVCYDLPDISALCGDEPVGAAKVSLSDGEAQMMRHLRPWQDTDGQAVAGSGWATQKTMIERDADQGVKRPTTYHRINGLLKKRHAYKLTVGQKGKRGTPLIMNPRAFIHVLNDLLNRPEEIRNAMKTVIDILKNGPLTEPDVITAASDRHKNPAVVQAAIQRLLASDEVVSHDDGKLFAK